MARSDVRDGLKPVHRRVLYAMNELGLVPGRPYKKSATVVRRRARQVPPARRSVTSEKKIVDITKYYNTERLRPIYEFDGAPLCIMTSD